MLTLADITKEWQDAQERMDIMEFINKHYEAVYSVDGMLLGYMVL